MRTVAGADWPEEPGARAFTWAMGLVLGAAWMALIARDASRLPIWDDWPLVPVLTGHEPLTPGWLWSLANEHRLPLPRLILLGAYRATGDDFRAGMVLSVLTLAGLAASWSWAARRVRGRSSYADACFPLLMLGFWHHANVLWSIQFAFILPTALAGLWLSMMLRSPGPIRRDQLAGSALIIAALPLCGATGLAYVPSLSAWTLGAAILARSDRVGRAFIASTVLVGLALTLFYFRDYHSAGQHESSPSIAGAVQASIQFLAGGLGPQAASCWPASGWLAVAAMASSAAAALRAMARHPQERARVSAFLAYLAGIGSLALGVGWGRAGMGDMAGFQDRYVTMAAPAWGAVALIFIAYGPAWLRRFAPMLLLVVLCVLTWPSALAALEHARMLRVQDAAIARDVKSGVPPYILTKKYVPFLHPSQDRLHRFLLMMREAGVGPFRAMRPDPAFREVPIPPRPSALSMAEWHDGVVRLTGIDPQLRYVLDPPVAVAGVRIRYSHRNESGTSAHLQLAWRGPGAAGGIEADRYSNWAAPTGDDCETTIWIGRTISELRLQPDNRPGTFRPRSITLLVP